jgi:hypothetical protein
MAKITIELIIRIAEIVGRIVFIIAESLKGEKNHDNSGNTKEK